MNFEFTYAKMFKFSIDFLIFPLNVLADEISIANVTSLIVTVYRTEPWVDSVGINFLMGLSYNTSYSLKTEVSLGIVDL